MGKSRRNAHSNSESVVIPTKHVEGVSIFDDSDKAPAKLATKKKKEKTSKTLPDGTVAVSIKKSRKPRQLHRAEDGGDGIENNDQDETGPDRKQPEFGINDAIQKILHEKIKGASTDDSESSVILANRKRKLPAEPPKPNQRKFQAKSADFDDDAAEIDKELANNEEKALMERKAQADVQLHEIARQGVLKFLSAASRAKK